MTHPTEARQPTQAPQQTIAVLGASSNRSKYGNKCVRAYAEAGWRVVPVHPSIDSVEGLPAIASLDELERTPERISVYLPPPVTARLLSDIAKHPSSEVWFNPGSATNEQILEARALGIDAVDGCSIVDIGRSPSQFPS
ncbi:MAG: CoA-binding protein [Acidobacteriota bacterium]